MEKRTAADILERVAQRYPNVMSRQSVLSNIKKFLTQDERYSDVVKDLCLPTECYHQIYLSQKHKRKIKFKTDAALLDYANEMINSSDNPCILLPCLVAVTRLKPIQLLKLTHWENSQLNAKLWLCKQRWPCENLTNTEIHQKMYTS